MFKRPVLFLTVILTTISSLCFVRDVAAQDPEFTQFYANPLYLNPAFAGTNRCPRVVLNYRNQWPALTGSFVTTSASYDQYVDAISGGLGLQVLRDNAGLNTLTTTSVGGIYSYQKPINNTVSFTAAVQVSYFQKNLDWGNLTFGDMIDPRRGFIYETKDIPRGGTVSNVDFSAGVLAFSETFYGGFAVHHLNEPNESLVVGEAPLSRKFTGHVGAVFPVAKDVTGRSETSLSPNIMYQRQAEFEQLNLGLYVQKGPLVGGVWYRLFPTGGIASDAFILLAGIQTDRFKFGYSYDLTTSALGAQTAGSHELSCALLFNCKPQKKKFRAINCPAF